MSKEEKESKQQVQKVEPVYGSRPFEEMERMFDNYFSHGQLRPFHFEWPYFSEVRYR